ncbi:hypothetical protein P5G50_00305 [Leifsonia sp. F6_8S_P_1B]|uniref:Mannosyltransferase n=1 Tax=Leifsonia williamsii TaxID=3035919 RepID=A0ABT8K5Y8_9MICO|nr:hypothetical protein [Leifsonia williamsii]MDN4612875.1 hypothetical protein [Leifsonia williamsii]
MTVLTGQARRTRAEPLAAVRPWTIALAFGLVAAVVCAAGSWIPSLWGDEAATLLSAKRPLDSLARMVTHVDAVHGVYYLGMHGWIRIAGESAFALRLPSAIAVGAAVAGVTLLAGRRGGPSAAIVAGVVATVLPRLTYAGEEARSYALTAAVAVWLTLLLLWLLDGAGRDASPSRRRLGWVLYGVGLAAGSYLFLYFVSIALAHAAIVLLSRASRPALRAWAISTAAAVLALAPLIVVAFLERRQIRYLGAQTLDYSTLLWAPWFWTPWFAVLAWALIVAAAVPVWRAWRLRRRAGAAAVSAPPPISATTVALCVLLLPTGGLVLADLVFPLYAARYSTFAAPFAALAMAEGVLVIGRRLGRTSARRAMVATASITLVVVAACAPVYVLQRGPYAKNDSDWAEVSAAVAAHARPGDAVVFDERARPSQRPRLAMRTYPDGFAEVRDVTLQVPYDRNIGWADRAYSVPRAAQHGRFDGVRRVWLLELVIDGEQHTYGMDDLEDLGFQETGVRVSTHRTVLIELTR